MSKRGLPTEIKMRHDWHYVEEIAQSQRSIGRILPLDKITPNPAQPRVEIGDLTELSASIKEKGVLEPLLVKPSADRRSWLIIAGERRWRAARLAGLTEVPCVELDIDEREIAEIALIENLQRKDLTVWEEADGLAALCLRFGYTHGEVARRIGKSRSSVTESLTIANIPTGVKEKCLAADINAKSAILQIARQFDEAAMLDAVERQRQTSGNRSGQPDVAVTNDLAKDLSLNSNSASGLSAEKASPGNPLNPPKTHVNTRLTSPVRAYSYQPAQGDFKLAIKFKKPTDKIEIIKALKNLLSELENER